MPRAQSQIQLHIVVTELADMRVIASAQVGGIAVRSRVMRTPTSAVADLFRALTEDGSDGELGLSLAIAGNDVGNIYGELDVPAKPDRRTPTEKWAERRAEVQAELAKLDENPGIIMDEDGD